MTKYLNLKKQWVGGLEVIKNVGTLILQVILKSFSILELKQLKYILTKGCGDVSCLK